jgi:hypothetical protein
MLIHCDEDVTLSNILTAQCWAILVHAINNEGASLGVATKDNSYADKRLHLLGRWSALVATEIAFRKIGEHTTLVRKWREGSGCRITLGYNEG